METPQPPDRNLAMELARVTEAAALAAGRWMGRGDKNAADGAAVDAMRLVLNSISMDGVVVIGEGEKDEAPMLFNGEQIGDGSPPSMDIAVDPVAQGNGIGTALVAFAESEARRRNIGELLLYTNARMLENLRFYKHLGFEITARKTEEGYDRIYMRKKL